MPLQIPSTAGRLIKQKIDSLSSEEKKSRDAVFNAMGQGIEEYVQLVLLQLLITIPQGPSPPVTLPGAAVFK